MEYQKHFLLGGILGLLALAAVSLDAPKIFAQEVDAPKIFHQGLTYGISWENPPRIETVTLTQGEDGLILLTLITEPTGPLGTEKEQKLAVTLKPVSADWLRAQLERMGEQ